MNRDGLDKQDHSAEAVSLSDLILPIPYIPANPELFSVSPCLRG